MQSLLVEVFGDAPHSLKVLSFFLGRPLYPYRKGAIAQVLGLSMEDVDLALVFFVDRGYVIKSGNGFELNRAHPMVTAIVQSLGILTEAKNRYGCATGIDETKPHYFKVYPVNKSRQDCIICGKSKKDSIHKRWRGANVGKNLRDERVGADK